MTKGFGLYEFGYMASRFGSLGGSHGLKNRSSGVEFELNAMKSFKLENKKQFWRENNKKERTHAGRQITRLWERNYLNIPQLIK